MQAAVNAALASKQQQGTAATAAAPQAAAPAAGAQPAAFKPRTNQEISLGGQSYRFLGQQWAEVNPKTNKAGKIAAKGLVPELNKIASKSLAEAKKIVKVWGKK